MGDTKKAGTIAWTDLTVKDAASVRDFYHEVVGWVPQGVSMGDYDDFNMIPPGTESPAAGICHARGVNDDQPAVWMIYIIVESLEESLEACREKGGEILVGPKSMGPGSSYAVIKDPAGAVCALYQTGD
jgi:predicted enzyme related to lactoylglutathione lyase